METFVRNFLGAGVGSIDRDFKLTDDLYARMIKCHNCIGFNIQVHMPSKGFKKLEIEVHDVEEDDSKNLFNVKVYDYCLRNNRMKVIHESTLSKSLATDGECRRFHHILQDMLKNLDVNSDVVEKWYYYSFKSEELLGDITANLLHELGRIENIDTRGYIYSTDSNGGVLDGRKLRMYDETWNGGGFNVAYIERQNKLLEAGYNPFLRIVDRFKTESSVEFNTAGVMTVTFGHPCYGTTYLAKFWKSNDGLDISFLREINEDGKLGGFQHTLFSLNLKDDESLINPKFKNLNVFARNVYNVKFDNISPMDSSIANLLMELSNLASEPNARALVKSAGIDDVSNLNTAEINNKAVQSFKKHQKH